MIENIFIIKIPQNGMDHKYEISMHFYTSIIKIYSASYLFGALPLPNFGMVTRQKGSCPKRHDFAIFINLSDSQAVEQTKTI